jgi:uncharacterized iron-regulated protein
MNQPDAQPMTTKEIRELERYAELIRRFNQAGQDLAQALVPAMVEMGRAFEQAAGSLERFVSRVNL